MQAYIHNCLHNTSDLAGLIAQYIFAQCNRGFSQHLFYNTNVLHRTSFILLCLKIFSREDEICSLIVL